MQQCFPAIVVICLLLSGSLASALAAYTEKNQGEARKFTFTKDF